MQKEGYLPTEITDEQRHWVNLIVQAVQEKIHTINEIADFMLDEDVPIVMAAFRNKLAALENWEAEQVKKIFKEISKETGLKGKKVFMPIRVALTGQMHGPDLHFIIPILGKELVAERLKQTLGE